MRIALFDLDGTITYRDTLLPFVLGRLAQRPWQLLRLLRTLPAIVRYIVDRDRGELKGALLRATMRGQSRLAIERWAEEFAARIVATQIMPGARAAIDRHRVAGDRLILMSASVDLYVPRLGTLLGFQEVICTPVRWRDGALDGRLAGANCRDQEKVSQLRRIMSQHPGVPMTAYGNSLSDVPHLRLADTGVFVNAPPRARAAIERQGLTCQNWR